MNSIYFLISLALFAGGAALVTTRKNIVMMLMGVELLLNAANLNFIGFAANDPNSERAEAFVVIVIVIAAAQAAVALSLVLQTNRRFGTLDITRIRELKG